MQLNPQQEQAVNHSEGPVLILAGAGSGKTRVLTNRISHLINNKKVDPDRILAVTFTNKAAGEMKERVQTLTGAPHSSMWISTFHALCLRILRSGANKIGYRNNFVIFNDSDQTSLIKACLKSLNISEEMIAPSAAVHRISRCKDSCITPEKFEAEASDFWSQRFAPVYAMYQAELMKQNGMDFGDLIFNVVRLFEKHPEVLNYFQNKFEYVLVDEYQDTNNVQYKLVKSLAEKHGNLFVVGDEDQSIYGWRGADISNILDFKHDFPGSLVIKLEQNYRSTQTILKAANSVIKNNKGRIGKNLWSDLPGNEKVTITQKMDGLDESRFITNQVTKYVKKGYRYDDMAIFYRTNAQSRVFEESFRHSGIPYMIYGGMKFYDRAEVRDIIAYLQFLLDQNNDTALKRIINVPTRGIGKSTIDKIRDAAVSQNSSHFEAIASILNSNSLPARAHKKLRAFQEMIETLKGELPIISLGSFVERLLEVTGYLAVVKKGDSVKGEEREENIKEFLKATYEFDDVASVSLPEFLDQIALVSDVDSYDQRRGAIPLMTVHLSKGLEFPVVFMVGMEENLFPHSRSIDDDDQLEEERRLCYVGMTRAKEKLFMTYCCKRKLFGREQYNLPSRFIDEVDSKYVDRANLIPSRESSLQSAKCDFDSSFEQQYVSDDFDQRPVSEKSGILRVGTKVRHKVFGEGTVRKVEGSQFNQKVIVQFATGAIKTLVVKYAQLEILG